MSVSVSEKVEGMASIRSNCLSKVDTVDAGPSTVSRGVVPSVVMVPVAAFRCVLMAMENDSSVKVGRAPEIDKEVDWYCALVWGGSGECGGGVAKTPSGQNELERTSSGSKVSLIIGYVI